MLSAEFPLPLYDPAIRLAPASHVIHFSLLASCKRHGHDPWAYYRDIPIRLPAMLPAAGEEDLLGLPPHLWKPA